MLTHDQDQKNVNATTLKSTVAAGSERTGSHSVIPRLTIGVTYTSQRRQLGRSCKVKITSTRRRCQENTASPKGTYHCQRKITEGNFVPRNCTNTSWSLWLDLNDFERRAVMKRIEELLLEGEMFELTGRQRRCLCCVANWIWRAPVHWSDAEVIQLNLHQTLKRLSKLTSAPLVRTQRDKARPCPSSCWTSPDPSSARPSQRAGAALWKEPLGRKSVERWELSGGQRAQWVSEPPHYQACLSASRQPPSNPHPQFHQRLCFLSQSVVLKFDSIHIWVEYRCWLVKNNGTRWTWGRFLLLHFNVVLAGLVTFFF